MHARQSVPQRHVDPGERHPHQPLRPEQAEAAGEIMRDSGRRQKVALNQRCQVLDQIRGGFERRRSVGEDDPMSYPGVAGTKEKNPPHRVLTDYFYAHELLIKDFARWAEPLNQMIRQKAEQVAAEAGLKVEVSGQGGHGQRCSRTADSTPARGPSRVGGGLLQRGAVFQL